MTRFRQFSQHTTPLSPNIASPTTNPRLENTGRGLTVFFENRYLYSKYEPMLRPKRAAELAPIENRCIYVVPSPLLGYGLNTLAKRIPNDSFILAIEVFESLMNLCAPYAEKNDRAIHVRLSDFAALNEVFNSIGPWNYRRVRRVDLGAGSSLNPKLYDELITFLIDALINYWRNRNTLLRLGRQWIRHVYANLCELAYGLLDIQSVNNLIIDRVPVIVGAGPSLEEALPFIRKYRKRLWVMAADTAVSALLTYGIKPDAAVVLETQPWNLLDFHDTEGSGIAIVADLSSYPPSLTHIGGPCYLYSSTFAELEFLRKLEACGVRDFTLDPLGSVGLVAIEIALARWKGSVLLAGLDFGYSHGKTHARGTAYHRWQMLHLNRLNPHPGWETLMLRTRNQKQDTDSVLNGYAALLRRRFSETGRLYVLPTSGTDLNLPLLEDAETILLENQKGITRNGEAPNWRAETARFIDAQLNGLQEIIDSWEVYAKDTKEKSRLISVIEKMDEVYVDFPDTDPLSKENESFLVRVVNRARVLLDYIEGVRSSVRAAGNK